MFASIREHSSHAVTDDDLRDFADRIHWVPGSAGPQGIRAAVDESEAILGEGARRLHYLSRAAQGRAGGRAPARRGRAGRAQPDHHGEAVRHRPRERPRAQRRAARGLRRGADLPHRPLPRQGGGAEHPRLPLRQRPLRADLAPQPHRPHPDRRARGARPRRSGPTSTRPPAPTATWWSPTSSRCWRSPRWSRRPRSSRGDQRGEEQGLPVDAADRAARRRARPVRRLPRRVEGVAPDSETETFVALKCYIDNWRWAGVPFYLRTGKRLAEGARIISIAFKEPPRSMFPPGSGVGDNGPDHLTFDLADQSKMSLSFYGKRPGPGMKLDKLSMQFAMQRDRLGRRGARGLRAADLRRRPRRPHALHHGRGHRAALGDLASRCSTTRRSCGPTTPARGAPTRSTSSSRRSPGACRSSATGGTRTSPGPDPWGCPSGALAGSRGPPVKIERSASLRVSSAARSNASPASVCRPARSSRSPRTACR